MKNIILIALSLFLLIQCKNEPEISQWRGPNRDGLYPETGLLKEWPENGPELLWKYDELGHGYSSAAIANNMVYTVGTLEDSMSYIFAFSHTGDLLWKNMLGREWMKNFPGMNSTPLIYGDKGYILNGLGKLYCFNSIEGNIIWEKDLFTEFDGRNNTYGITENLLIDNDKLFCTPGGIEDNVVALNRHTGNLIWKSKGSGNASRYASPNLFERGGNKYLTTFTDSAIFALDAESGELTWKHYMKNGSSNVPIYKNGYLFAMGGPEGLMIKISEDGKSSKIEWKTDKVTMGFGDGVVLNGKIYGSHGRNKNIYCIDWKSGEVIDSVETKLIASVIAADNMIYSYDFRGDFSLLKHDENGLNMVSTFQIKGGNEKEHCAQPVIKDGRLYVRHDNSLFVYDIAQKS